MLNSDNFTFTNYLKKYGGLLHGQDRYDSDLCETYNDRLDAGTRGRDLPELPTIELSDLKSPQRQIRRKTTTAMYKYAATSLDDMNNEYEREKPHWQKNTPECQLCGKQFTTLFRRHHCRQCGLVVCKFCGPKLNAKPIPALGYKQPQRHCVRCYRSPFVDWDALAIHTQTKYNDSAPKKMARRLTNFALKKMNQFADSRKANNDERMKRKSSKEKIIRKKSSAPIIDKKDSSD